MTENERLKLIQKELDFPSQTAFADALGIKQGSLSDIYRQKSGVGVSGTIKAMLEKIYKVNIKWLETGSGDMLTTDHPPSSAADKSIRKPKTKTKEEVIPVFDRVVAQQGKMIESLIPTTETDKYGLAKKEMFRNAQFVVRSSGNSMLPNYPPDAWIGIRMIDGKNINPGSVYAIDLGSDLVLKRVYYKDDDQYSGIIECISDNTMVEDHGARKGKLKYPPYEIEMTDIKGMYKVTDVYRPNEMTVLQ